MDTTGSGSATPTDTSESVSRPGSILGSSCSSSTVPRPILTKKKVFWHFTLRFFRGGHWHFFRAFELIASSQNGSAIWRNRAKHEHNSGIAISFGVGLRLLLYDKKPVPMETFFSLSIRTCSTRTCNYKISKYNHILKCILL